MPSFLRIIPLAGGGPKSAQKPRLFQGNYDFLRGFFGIVPGETLLIARELFMETP
jgi:hypothetical protein